MRVGLGNIAVLIAAERTPPMTKRKRASDRSDARHPDFDGSRYCALVAALASVALAALTSVALRSVAVLRFVALRSTALRSVVALRSVPRFSSTDRLASALFVALLPLHAARAARAAAAPKMEIAFILFPSSV